MMNVIYRENKKKKKIAKSTSTVGKDLVARKSKKLKIKKLKPPAIPRAFCGKSSPIIKPGRVNKPTVLAPT